MKCLIIDYHSTATRDVSLALKELGYEVDTWNLSNHMWIFGEERSNVPFINEIPLSSFYLGIGKDFWKANKNLLEKYDFFITGHTPCLSLLLSETKKPMIVCITTRYEHPFTGNAEEWKKFNDYLLEGYSKNLISFVANNYYDANYFAHYTGVMPKTIQSLCQYHEGLWEKKKEEFVLYSKLKISGSGLYDLKATGKYSWKDWYSYAGVFCIPYQASTMSLFEFAAAGMPVKYPGIEETLQLRQKFPGKVLSEISWRNISPQYSNSQYKLIETYGTLPSPNSLDDDSLKHWLQYSDCYTDWMPNVIGNNSKISFEFKKKFFLDSWKYIVSNIRI